MNRADTGILFLGGAKRVSMARKFKAAAAARDMGCRIYSYEMTTDVPIALEGEVLTGLRWRDPRVVADIVRICREKDIDTVIPFVDGAVAVAAQVATAGIFAPVYTAEGAELMFDKIRADKAFSEAGLPVPEVWDGGPLRFPLIAKPRHGSASKGLVFIDTQEALDFLAHKSDYLIQRRYDSRREITVDCYTGMHDGQVKACVPRTRDEVTGGEVSRTTVIHDTRITGLATRVLRAFSNIMRGAITIQFLHDTDSDRLMIMEINPRLGGGAVAAVAAGADLPGMIIDEASGKDAAVCTAYRDAVVARYQDEAVFYI